jgi:hypothetical protein
VRALSAAVLAIRRSETYNMRHSLAVLWKVLSSRKIFRQAGGENFKDHLMKFVGRFHMRATLIPI